MLIEGASVANQVITCNANWVEKECGQTVTLRSRVNSGPGPWYFGCSEDPVVERVRDCPDPSLAPPGFSSALEYC